jgi:hypothetical protein
VNGSAIEPGVGRVDPADAQVHYVEAVEPKMFQVVVDGARQLFAG